MRPFSLQRCLRFAAVLSLALAAARTAAVDYSSAVLADGPLTYYRFSETSVVTVPPWAANLGTLGDAALGYDASGSSSGAVVRGVPGALADPANTAFEFPGLNNARVVVQRQPDLATDGPFSIEFWAKPAAVEFACPGAMMKYWTSGSGCEDGNRYGWLIYQSDTGDWETGHGWMIRLYSGSGSATAGYAEVGMTVVPNTWYHIVAAYTGSEINLYVNGVLQNTGAVSGYRAVPYPAYPLTLGSRGYTGSASYWEYKGALDEVAFYTQALSADDVAAHYAAATTNAAGYEAMILAHHPAGYWRFNELNTPPPTAQNSSGAGAALDGAYQYFSMTTPGLQGPDFGGFETANQVLQLAASPNGYVSTPALDTPMTSATFEAWIKRSGTQADTAGLIMHRNGTATHGLSFQSDGLQLAYNWNDASGAWLWQSGLIPPDGQWAYVALTISPSVATMYLYDGTTWSATSNVLAHGAATFAAPTLLGYDPFNTARHYNGLLDEVAVYNQALTEGQLRSHALAGFGDTHAPSFVTDPPLLLTVETIYAGWPFALRVDAYGAAPLTFQWRNNGNPIPNATNATYTVTAAAGSDSGNYDVVVTNPYGSATTTVPLAVTVVTTPPDVTTGLRTWLKFNETTGLTAADSSGNGRPGALHGFAGDDSQWVAGCLGNALAVNPYFGAQQVVLLTDDGGLDFSANREFTLAAWVNADPALQGVNGGIIAKGYGSGQEEYCLDLEGGHYRFFVRDANGAARVLTTSVAPTGPYWQHVAAVFSAPRGWMKVFINGVEVAGTTPPSTLLANNHEVSIGARQQSSEEGAPYDFDLVGLIDDARILARALVPAEVQALYNQAPLIPPVIAQNPQGRSVLPGGSVTLTGGAVGSMPLKYQWYFNGTTPVAGATTATLTIANVNTGNVGDYALTVTNTAGSASTLSATVGLLPAPSGTYENCVVADAPEAYWRLNETGDGTGIILDSMGRHDGAAYSFGSADGGANFTFAQAGALTDNPDPCIQFIASSQNQIRVPYSAALNPTPFTVECWAHLTTGPANDSWYAPCGSATSTAGYALYAGGEDPSWQAWLYLGSFAWGVVFGPDWGLAQWTHLALTYDGNVERLYVNGVLAGALPKALVQNTTAPFDIGAGANDSFAFDGLIDEVACYPTALSAARIHTHYALGAQGANSVPVFIVPPSAQAVPVGATATFTATVVGAPTLRYQWKKDGVDLPGETSLSLSIPNADYTDGGHQYQLAAVNSVGTTVSDAVTLTVMPPASQTNLVIRVQAGSSGSVLELIWPAGTLYAAEVVTGPWLPVSGAMLPYCQVAPTSTQQYFRVQ